MKIGMPADMQPGAIRAAASVLTGMLNPSDAGIATAGGPTASALEVAPHIPVV